ncbi:MAG: ACP S-malonyltransferase [Ignavibacteria bacterium]|nr:ACP S-malonyltransferase [Ignavibacteria bacterium]
MKYSFIFPGQGSQYVGMGEDLYTEFTEARDLFNMADEILGFELSKICFEGPSDKLKQTYITQPAIFTHSIVVSRLLNEKIIPVSVSGHSLGEYTALTYAGVLSFEDGLKLVKRRGELMQEAGELSKGTMAAIIGLEGAVVEKICNEVSGVVCVANFNSPGQIVISGDLDSVARAMEMAKLTGAKMVKQLEVHGAFHSPLMSHAADGLKSALEGVSFKSPRVPVFRNTDAKPIMPDCSPDEVKDSLVKQLTSSVRWEECVLNMINYGTEKFVELGPGKVLQGLVKRINSSVNTLGFDKAKEIKQFLNQE